MKKLFLYAFSFVFVFALGGVLVVDAAKPATSPAPKVGICHYDKDSGTYHLINVSENAKQAHLDHMDKLPGDFVPGYEGDKKFALDCSMMGYTLQLVDTVTVPGTSGAGASSSETLESGKYYVLKASGTYRFANWGAYGIADAEWAYRDAAHAPGNVAGWVKGEGYYASPCGLDVQVNNTCVDWGDLSLTNEYTYEMAGDDDMAHFHVYDNVYTDNSGSINVDIYQKVW